MSSPDKSMSWRPDNCCAAPSRPIASNRSFFTGRRVLAAAANRLENTGQTTILFIDEIHRFNKAQQDVLLPDVESGVVRLIGATTHNPFFFVNSPLVSRSQIFELRPLGEEDLLGLLRRSLGDAERGLGGMKIRADDDALAHLAKVADGDARKALNAL